MLQPYWDAVLWTLCTKVYWYTSNRILCTKVYCSGTLVVLRKLHPGWYWPERFLHLAARWPHHLSQCQLHWSKKVLSEGKKKPAWEVYFINTVYVCKYHKISKVIYGGGWKCLWELCASGHAGKTIPTAKQLRTEPKYSLCVCVCVRLTWQFLFDISL